MPKPKVYQKTKEVKPDRTRFEKNEGGGIFEQFPDGPVSSMGQGVDEENPNAGEIDRSGPQGV